MKEKEKGTTHPMRDRVVVAHVHGGGLQASDEHSKYIHTQAIKPSAHSRTPRPQANLRRVPIRPAHVHPARVALPEVADGEERAAGLGAADEAGAGGAGARWEVSGCFSPSCIGGEQCDCQVERERNCLVKRERNCKGAGRDEGGVEDDEDLPERARCWQRKERREKDQS